LTNLLQRKSSKLNSAFYKTNLHYCKGRCLEHSGIHPIEKKKFMKETNLQLVKFVVSIFSKKILFYFQNPINDECCA
jgi:hypothetical protein